MRDNGERLELLTPEGEMGVYQVRPDGPVRGALIIIHGAFGPNAHVDELGRRFAGYGYQTLVPNLYHRTTKTVLDRGEMVDVESVERVCRPHLSRLSTSTCSQDLAASIEHLRAAGFEDRQIGVVGFCLGGPVAFLAGVRWKLGAVVSFYGGSAVAVANMGFERSPIEMASELQSPYLGLFGDHDATTPIAEIEELRAALRSAKVPSEIIRYPYAGHGFHEDDLPELYIREAALDGERRAFDWLDRHIAAKSPT